MKMSDGLCRKNGANGSVREADTPLGKLVELWRLIHRTAIGTDALVAHVVGHDEDDVRPVIGMDGVRQREGEGGTIKASNGMTWTSGGVAGDGDSPFDFYATTCGFLRMGCVRVLFHWRLD